MSDVIMERDGARTEVHPGSVATMRGLGWAVQSEVAASFPRQIALTGAGGGHVAPRDLEDLRSGDPAHPPATEAGVQPGDQIVVKAGRDGPITTNVHPRDPDGVPAGWRDMPWPQRRSLAKRLQPSSIIRNDVDAYRVIEAELARRRT